MKAAGSSLSDAEGASGQLSKAETAERSPSRACGGPVACVARKRLPIESQLLGNWSLDVT
jgi:hypothetical protein